MRIESKPPASAENGCRGEVEEQVSKTYYPNYSVVANDSQYEIRWLSSNYHLPLPVADLIAGLAGLGGNR